MNTQGKLHERKPKKQEEMKTVLGALRRGGGGGKGLCSGENHCVSMPFLRQDAQMPRPLAWPTSKNSHPAWLRGREKSQGNLRPKGEGLPSWWNGLPCRIILLRVLSADELFPDNSFSPMISVRGPRFGISKEREICFVLCARNKSRGARTAEARVTFSLLGRGR